VTTLPEAREAIYAWFLQHWVIEAGDPPTIGPRTLSTLDNEAGFEEPTDGSPWVRVSVRHFAASQQTLGKAGNRKFERQAATFVQVYVKPDGGTKDADLLAHDAAAIFEGVSLDGTTIHFGDVITRETGPDGKWYGVLVEARFRYTETK
jgi:hypothetical protein